MGNDGGSIPKRDDLVKTKKADQKADKQSTNRQLWSYCQLSKQPLRAPIVSDALGRLYNKEAVIAHLLAASSGSPSPFGTDGTLVLAHLRSLRDLSLLSLTPNPTLLSQSVAEAESSSNIGTQENHATAAFVCPLSLREMNGTVRFVYRKPCGCVLSESSLKEMRRGEKEAGEEGGRLPCPVTGEVDPEGTEEEWVTLNPVGEEAERMKDAWETTKLREKDEKKAAKDRKRKAAPPTTDADAAVPTTKKAKPLASAKVRDAVPHVGSSGASVPKLSATLAAKIAEQKKSQSAAVASLYAPKDDGTNKDKDGRSNWMTRGAFTRYA